MPACPIRSWSVPTNDAPRPNTMASKEMEVKLKEMMAKRNALDQHVTANAEVKNPLKGSS